MPAVTFVPKPDWRMVIGAATFPTAWRQFGLRAEALAIEECPRAKDESAGGTPLYRSHFVQASVDPVYGWRIYVGANKSYAYFVHQGTSPHVIAAHNPPRALRFTWAKAGGVVFFANVHHPGTKPQPWLWKATSTVIRSTLV